MDRKNHRAVSIKGNVNRFHTAQRNFLSVSCQQPRHNAEPVALIVSKNTHGIHIVNTETDKANARDQYHQINKSKRNWWLWFMW